MATETGKQRSQRIQIDYFRRRGGLHHFRTWCIACGLGAAVVYSAYVIVAGGSHLSTGPLSSVHASFEDDCSQCHRGLTPIDPHGSKLNIGLLGVHSEASAAHLESACQTCHRVGDHYRETMTDSWKLADQACSHCHSDHQGRDQDLTRVASKTCVSCHSDLVAGCLETPRVRSEVTGFDKGTHGDFASLAAEDTGIVKFDHAQHLLPGQVDADMKGGFTVGQLSPQDRLRYAQDGQDESDLVTLSCASCHEMAGRPEGETRLIADAELGRYIAPISFDRHCAACHALNPEVATRDSTPIPHAVPWNQVDLLLAANAKGAIGVGLGREARNDSQPVPLPGEGFGAEANADAAQGYDLDRARQMVQSKCLQCHDEASISDEAIVAYAAPDRRMIPSRFLRHGLYDHAAHSRIDCRYCHEAAYPREGPTGPAEDHQKVMIAGIDSCTWCHRPDDLPSPVALTDAVTKELINGQPTWASDQCTLCHRYHTMTDGADHQMTSFDSSAAQEAAP